MQIKEQTFEGTVAMYMKNTKQRLAEMLAALDTQPHTDHKNMDDMDIIWGKILNLEESVPNVFTGQLQTKWTEVIDWR